MDNDLKNAKLAKIGSKILEICKAKLNLLKIEVEELKRK